MPRPAAVLAALLVLVPVGCGGDGVSPPAWNHDPEDAELGPAAWGGQESYEQCSSGAEQSPVDLAATAPAELPPLRFDYAPTPLVVENTGHVIEVPMPESSELTLGVGDDEYRLLQYHFHAPSEHTLDDEPFDAEAHLVHESDAGELAVVGVFFEASDALALGLVESVVENAPEEAGEEVEVDVEADPRELLAALGAEISVSGYYTYPGSLTTPGCAEGVRWIVLPGAMPISASSTERLHELVAGFPGYDGYPNNNRPTQPLNEREIEAGGG